MMNPPEQRENSIENLLKKHFSSDQNWQQQAGEVQILVDLVETIRPRNPEKIEQVSIEVLLLFLEKYENYRVGLAGYLDSVLAEKKFSRILSDAGILKNLDFWSEAKSRLISKILPQQPDRDTLQFLLNQVFYLDSDPVWISKISEEQLVKLLELLDFQSNKTGDGQVLRELLFAMEVLTFRICGTAMEPDVNKMVPEFENLQSPFLSFQQDMKILENKLLASDSTNLSPDDEDFRQVLILLKQCDDYVSLAFQNSAKYGISMRVNQNLLKIRQQLQRLRLLLQILPQHSGDSAATNTIEITRLLIEINCRKNSLAGLFGQSTQTIAYEITQHTARTGERYITESKSEYRQMFEAALGGGLIVGMLVISKLKMSKLPSSDFGFAFNYGMNYAIGFILIYLLGFTLATKQPAMTASALAKSLREGIKSDAPEDVKHRRFAELFARLFRSQFIAFVGNVLMAFPIALFWIWYIDQIWGENIAATKWTKLIGDLHPLQSAAVFHAAIAGFYLFLSGLIAGNIANRDKHHRVYYRIQEHPLLKKTFGAAGAARIAAVYEKRWAGIVSNFWFGIFLGSTYSIGSFFGLNLDIRHITFAAGNFAMGLYGSGFSASLPMIFWSLVGIFIIGLVNFLVSFCLSLFLAFRSRGIPFSEIRPVGRSIFHHFRRFPRSFFLP